MLLLETIIVQTGDKLRAEKIIEVAPSGSAVYIEELISEILSNSETLLAPKEK